MGHLVRTNPSRVGGMFTSRNITQSKEEEEEKYPVSSSKFPPEHLSAKPNWEIFFFWKMNNENMNLKSKTIEMHTRTREGQKVELKKKCN